MTVGWEHWDGLHDEEDQTKRLASAKKAGCTPIVIDYENQTGTFSGSSGVYQTSLLNCPCVDYMRRKKPCKHMYRLAIELGQLNEDVAADTSAIQAPPPKDSFTLAEAVAILESAPKDEQLLLKRVLYEIMYHKATSVGVKQQDMPETLLAKGLLEDAADPVSAIQVFKRNELNQTLKEKGVEGFNKNMKLADLAKWVHDNVPEYRNVVGDVRAVRLPLRLRKSRQKVYTYLKRKFDTEELWDHRTGEMIYVPYGIFPSEITVKMNVSTGEVTDNIGLPDDEITLLLNKYGVDRSSELPYHEK
ncbi:MAG: hypothetical protein FWH32_01495 [Clostridiales bacterium]|nr:hypothetical protein [Clostridiales bacterium]